MNIRKLGLAAFFTLGTLALAGQVYRVDTISTQNHTHMYLNIEIPVGEMYMSSSGYCGQSIARLSSPDSQIYHQVQTATDPYGNHRRTVSLHSTARKQPSSRLATSNLRFTEQITSFGSFSTAEVPRSEYNPDPSISTDLYLDLGVGASRLDFSGLSLHNVSINSAFSDVMVIYHEPNQISMQEMDIHAAKADVILKNLEYARAELITIQNDMGQTKLILGGSRMAESTIYLQAGVGSCVLVISENQPAKLVLKTGLFSDVEMAESFKEIQKGVFVNQAFERHPEKGTKIICNLDFGSISVMENE